jgi:predicted enzyme related to lactoylglutathione lyase
MPTMTSYAPGSFCWADLATTDQDAAKKFYGAIFGWTANDYPMGDGAVYSMMQKDGKDAAAISILQPEQAAAGMPPHWNSYIAVQNIDKTAEKATALGGSVVLPPMDVPETGRMAVLQDPSGAYVSLWQPGPFAGAAVANEYGAICWNELLTKDTGAAKSFYNGLLGWNAEEMPMSEMNYTIFKNGDKQSGGMFPIDPSWGPVPPNWMVYFAIENCDATCEQVKSLGGKVLMGPQSVATVGTFATCQDPQGGSFAILQPEMKA